MKKLDFLKRTVAGMPKIGFPHGERGTIAFALAAVLSMGASAYSPPTEANWLTDAGDAIREWVDPGDSHSIGGDPDVKVARNPAPPALAPAATPPAADAIDEAAEARAKAEALRRAEERAEKAARNELSEINVRATRKALQAAQKAATVNGITESLIKGISMNIHQNSAEVIIKKSIGSVVLVITLDEIATYGLRSPINSWANEIVIETRVSRFLRNNPNAKESEVRTEVVAELKSQLKDFARLEAEKEAMEAAETRRANAMGRPGDLSQAAEMLFTGKPPSTTSKADKADEPPTTVVVPVKTTKPKPAKKAEKSDTGEKFDPGKPWIDLSGWLNNPGDNGVTLDINAVLNPTPKPAAKKTVTAPVPAGKGPLAACRNAGVPAKLLGDCARDNATVTTVGASITYTY